MSTDGDKERQGQGSCIKETRSSDYSVRILRSVFDSTKDQLSLRYSVPL